MQQKWEKRKEGIDGKRKEEWDGDRHFMSYKEHRTTRVIPIFPTGFDRLTAKNRNLMES